MYLNTQVQYNKLNKDEKKILLLQKLAHLTDFTFDRYRDIFSIWTIY